MKPGISAEARQVHAAALIADLHCDLLLTSYFLGWDWSRRHYPNRLLGGFPMGSCDLPRLREGNVGCLALGLVVNPLRGRSGPAAVRRWMDRFEAEQLRAPDAMELATTAQAVRAARAHGRIAVMAGLEGAHGLDGKLDALPGLRDRGLVYVGLCHFSANAACRPMVGWGADPRSGLTGFGRDLVDELVRLRILVDVAHVNRAGLLETCARTPLPVICSHTACTAVHPSPRGLDDEQIRAVADTGGVVGIIFARPFVGPGGIDAVAAHLDHVRTLVGIAHCAIGSDWEGWVPMVDGLESADGLPGLTDALLRRGWSADDVHAATGGNFLRVLEQVRG